MYVAARGVGCCCKLALGAIWALSPRPSSPPHSPSSHSTQVMTLLVTAAPNLKAGYWDNDRGLGMKCTHGTEVWGDTRSEKHLKNSSPPPISSPACFGAFSNLVCFLPAPILLSPALLDQSKAQARRCQQLRSTPTPSTMTLPSCFRALSTTSNKRNSRRKHKTLHCVTPTLRAAPAKCK